MSQRELGKMYHIITLCPHLPKAIALKIGPVALVFICTLSFILNIQLLGVCK